MKENAVLRAIRAMLKMKQEEFASLIGIGRSEYAIIETENLIVNNRIRSRAEAALGVSLDDPRIAGFIALGDQIEAGIKPKAA